MVKGKILLCRCEDVTLDDVEHSIARGYADIEEVKRYTGFGTGPCQGKECLAVVAAVIARCTGKPPAEVRAFTSRQPIAPTPLKLFAGIARAQADHAGHADEPAGPGGHDHRSGDSHGEAGAGGGK